MSRIPDSGGAASGSGGVEAGHDHQSAHQSPRQSAHPPAHQDPEGADPAGLPSGDVYEWYVRGKELLSAGSPDAAAQLLQRAYESEPRSLSVLETLARALFDGRRYDEAADLFRGLVARNPDDDYARFGLGLALTRQNQFEQAVEHLALAAAMRPGRRDYVRALREARATLEARRDETR